MGGVKRARQLSAVGFPVCGDQSGVGTSVNTDVDVTARLRIKTCVSLFPLEINRRLFADMFRVTTS
ncbi:hypothetical protein EYF80_059605 [Liparis tanakae]|uniref:Uncharacterized protein n=1 Tax=Liparis tanakae TaxID=230148 RepID=A0A4Z2EN61_9TELE|nr:hypothetical protein EYF80_059605 [Liparis tanakae]